MVKKEEYKFKIVNNLLKSSQSLKMLTKNVKDDLGEFQSNKRNTQFKEAIMELMKDGEIFISGYDFGVHNVKEKRKDTGTPRIQADIDKDGIIFELVRTEQTYVISLLNKLETLDDEKVKEAYISLKKLFYLKSKQLEDLYFEIWENELSKVDYWVLSDRIKELKNLMEKEKFYLKIIEGISPAMYKYDSIYNLEVERFNPSPGKPVRIKETKKVKPIEIMREKFKFLIGVKLGEILEWNKIVKKHENAKLWFILNDDKKSFNHTDENMFIDKEGSMNPEIVLNNILDQKNQGSNIPNPENLLEMKNPGRYSPIKHSDEEMDDIFRKILFYINIQNDNNFLKTFFSLALSDDKESLNWFEYFFKNIPLIIPSLEKKLSDDLKVVPKYTLKPIEGAQEGYKAHEMVQNW